MPIQVTCPGCLKRFQVNDKFAGKTGPCPNCSKPITIPAKSDEVVIHAPEDGGPKDSKGRPVFKPIRRQEVKVTLPIVLSIAAVAVIALGVALLVRFSVAEPPTALLVLGTMLLAPPLVWAGYWFLRDDELEGFQGTELIVRCAIVSAVFAVTWALYALIPMYLGDFRSLAEIEVAYLLLVVPIMIILGSAASVLALELEAVQGALHYLLFFAVTLTLALLMGTQIAQPFARSTPAPTNATSPGAGASSPGKARPTAQPVPSAKSPAAAPKSTEPRNDKRPRLLQ
ncbi:MAG: hypothetical protein ACTHOU_08065 [Aureliella sp.]|jgi:hypothetical protein